jgi:Cu-Zn family superoxide dismutase
MFKRTTLYAALIASSFLLGACAETRDRGLNASPTAACDLAATTGNRASGHATFRMEGGRMVVEVDLEGLSAGRHGIHVHEFGDCGNNAISAGGHFNPTGQKHGPGMLVDSHAGDLGNLVADADGHAHAVIRTEYLSFLGSTKVIGLSLIVDGAADDYVTQPDGNTGERVACGVIYQTGP